MTNDSPQQKAFVPISAGVERRAPRIGDSYKRNDPPPLDDSAKQLAYETNMALREADADFKQRPTMANIGFRAVKRKLRGSSE